MKCPTCDVALAMTDRQGIEIDYCPQCRGVWLDRGELDKLIERASAEAAPPPVQAQAQASRQAPPPAYETPRYPAHGYGGDHYKHKRKKNLLGELFDF